MTVRNKQNHLKYKNVITLKLTDIELNIVNRAATMAGLSRSEYIRQLILNGTVHVRYEIVADMDDLKKLVTCTKSVINGLLNVHLEHATGKNTWNRYFFRKIRWLLFL